MQNPTIKTPISRCFHLGNYAARMLGKFPNVPKLVDSAAKMSGITMALRQANDTYEQSKNTIVEARVDLKFTDLTTDIELQNLMRRVEIADNKARGPIFKLIAPEGKTAVVKPYGQKQLDVLNELFDVLGNLVPTWAGAAQEAATVDGLRQSYKAALDSREAAWQNARKLRGARNLTKQAFIKGYVEISFAVKELYPQDRKMQDLFFDDVDNEVEKDLGEDAPPPDGGTPPAEG